MTQEQSKNLLPIIQAFSEGKAIQVAYNDEEQPEWVDCTDPSWDKAYIYRIKPKHKYRPFGPKEECFEGMKKHEPFGWVKDNDCIYHINIIDRDGIYLSDWEDKIMNHSFYQAYSFFRFVDEEPFGIKENE